MADFYEIDFLQVHSKRSGDAIAIRYQIKAHHADGIGLVIVGLLFQLVGSWPTMT